MNRQQILDAIRSLSKSQGFYGRLLDYIYSMEEGDQDRYLSHLEQQKFRDSVELILYLED